jgi:hypothetical protein
VAAFPKFPRVPDHVREQIAADLLAGLTQKAAAWRHGVSQTFVSNLARERGIVSSIPVDERMREAREARRSRPRVTRVLSNAPKATTTRVRPIRPLLTTEPAAERSKRPRKRQLRGRPAPLAGPAQKIVSAEDRADIVSLWLAGRTKSDIAFMTGVDYGQVKPFVQKLKARGGWYSLVYVIPCRRCGRPFVTPRSHAVMHPKCRTASIGRMADLGLTRKEARHASE